MDRRTATTSTWLDDDGSMSVREYAVPHFFRAVGSSTWQPIDTTLVTDGGQGGVVHSRANSWQARFAAAGAPGGSEQFDDGHTTIGFTPEDANSGVLPQAQGSTATYRGLWPGVDLSDTVEATSSRENVVLTGPGTRSAFDFAVSGATVRARADGGADIVVDGSPVARIPAPSVSLAHPTTTVTEAPAGRERTQQGTGVRLDVKDGHTVELSVSPSWLMSLPASVFPVTIDPDFDYSQPNIAVGGPSGSAVTSMASWSSQGGGNSSQLIVGPDLTTGVNWVGAAYFTAPAPPPPTDGGPDWQLTSAFIQGVCEDSSCGLEPMDIYGLAQPQGTTPGYSDILNGKNLPTIDGRIDTGTWVAAGGFEAQLTGWFAGKSGTWLGFSGNRIAGNGRTSPVVFDGKDLSSTFDYYRNLSPTAITSPASGSSLASTTPTLTARPVQPYGQYEQVWYDFKLSTSADGTGALVDSGWLTTPSWTPPVGALEDGTTYYATVSDSSIDPDIGPDKDNYVPPAAPPAPIPLTVHLHLGSGDTSPTDTVGSPPQTTTTPSQGAPNPGTPPSSETVNLVTGNLALSVSTHAVETLSGSASPTLNYNSLESSTTTGSGYGLTGDYYLDTKADHVYPDQPVGQRIDRTINAAWHVGAPPIGGIPVSATSYLVRWTGQITLPAGSWQLGGDTTGGMRISVNGSASPLYDDWSGTATNSTPGFSSAVLTGGRQYSIEVDDWNWESITGNSIFPTSVSLWANNVGVKAGQQLVPSTWLTPVATGMPPGWTLSADTTAAAWSGLVDEGSQVVLHGSSGGTATFTRLSDGVYQAPAGDSDRLTRDGDDRLQLSTSAGSVYTFNMDGTLAAMATSADDRHPTSLQYGYSGIPLVLRTITDPVSNRQIQLHYSGDGTCPANAAPPGMLCQIQTWDGAVTSFQYNTNGQLSQITSPGQALTMLGYDSGNRLDDIRDTLATDYIASGRTDVPVSCTSASPAVSCPLDTTIGYDSAGRVQAVVQARPLSGVAAPERTYSYANGTASVLIAGQSSTATYSRQVSYDGKNQLLSSQNWNQNPALSAFNAAGQQIATVTPSQLQTSSVYDADGNVTDTYGPAPVACFTGTWPTGSSFPSGMTGYLPGAHPDTLAGCLTSVPHTHSGYDEGITGLAATYWPNGQFAGAPALHTIASSASAWCGTGGDWLCMNWPSALPVGTDGSGQFSVRATGTFTTSDIGIFPFEIDTPTQATVTIDGAPIVHVQPGTSGYVEGSQVNSGSGGIFLDAGTHTFEVDFVGNANVSTASGNGFAVLLQGGHVANTGLAPKYGLKTSTTDPDGRITRTAYSDAVLGPQYGLPTAVTTDPAGLKLTTSTGYETPGVGFLRKLSTTLPAGNTTSYAYYSGTGGPLDAVCGVPAGTPQGGQLLSQTDPAPSAGQSPREQQFVYDSTGRQVGERVATAATIAQASWQCTSFDARGRISGQYVPPAGGSPERTTTYSYGVGGNPLVSSVTDDLSRIVVTSTVDLMGRMVSYQDGGATTAVTYNQAGEVVASAGPGRTILSSYDDSGLLRSVGVLGLVLATATYDRAGRLTQVDYGNATTRMIGYDSHGVESSVMDMNSVSHTLLGGEQAVHSPGGELMTRLADVNGAFVNPNPAGAGAADYDYDGAGRLTDAWLVGVHEQYGYAAPPGSAGCPVSGTGANTNRTSVATTPTGGEHDDRLRLL